MPTIRIDDEVYSWLKSQAIPFDDTPNSVLRRLAGLEKHRLLTENKSKVDNRKNEGIKKETEVKIEDTSIMPKRPAKHLARLWKVNVVHALYHKDGTYYHHLTDFPGALFDPNGYVIFNTQREYEQSPYLQHGIELHVPKGIYSIPRYKRMR